LRYRGIGVQFLQGSPEPRELFDAVRQRLAELGPSIEGARISQDAPYAGLVFDEVGTAMVSTCTTKRRGVRYRYYVSRLAPTGERSKAAISRIPAPAFEAFMVTLLQRLALANRGERYPAQSVLSRIEIHAQKIVIQLHRLDAFACWRSGDPAKAGLSDLDLLQECSGRLTAGEILDGSGDQLSLSLPVRACFWGGRAALLPVPGMPSPAPRPDTAMIKALARAYRWRQMILDGTVRSIEELAANLKLDRGHVGLTLNLAFLSPDLMKAIVRGEQPPGLRLSHLLAADIPVSWHEQDALIEGWRGRFPGHARET
jgi:hypothetical protein